MSWRRALGAPALLALAAIAAAMLPAAPAHAQTPGPTVSTVAVTSTVPSGQGGYYKAGDDIAVTVTFNEGIVVTGSPALEITVGSAAKSASCARQGGTGDAAKKLVCTYRVTSGDADTNGISVGANKLTLPSGATIKDSSTNDATRTHNELANQSAHKVDGVAPAAPRGFAATAEVGQVRLTWSAPSPADASIAKWQVRQKAGMGSYGSWSDVAGGASARRRIVTGLMSGTTYTFELRAVDTATNAGASATAGPATPTAAISTAPVGQTVPWDWSLIPKDSNNNPLFTPGQRFRLLFVTSAYTFTTSADIATYNGLVQNAASSNAALRPFRSQFRALVSTSTVDARDNTATTGTGVPIYWVKGAKVADDYADFYDGSWDSRAAKSETGVINTYVNYIRTGSNNDGTKHARPAGYRPTSRYGSLAEPSDSPISEDNLLASFGVTLYALSPVITVRAVPAPTPPVAQTVLQGWSLIPKDSNNNPLFTPGQRFRLLFVTSAYTFTTSADIATYNGLVQNAASSNAALRPFRSQFRALVSTSTVDARDNTATTGTGVPIYWVKGAKVADDYADFYDGSWDSRAAKSETGVINTYVNYIRTGSNNDGTKHARPAGYRPTSRYGSLAEPSDSPISEDNLLASFGVTLYALSPVIMVRPDTTRPTVTTGSTGYYSDAALTSALTAPQKAGAEIYVKVTFSEDMKHVASNLAAARPEIFHRIGTTDTQYDVLAPAGTLASGDCKPSHATNTNVYVCRYTVGASVNGTFAVKVGTNSADKANNALASAYTHAATLTLDTTDPGIAFPPSPATPRVRSASTITLTDATSKVAKYAILEVAGTETDATGCDDPAASADNFSTTAVSPAASPKRVSYTPSSGSLGKKVCVYVEDAAGNRHAALWTTAIAAPTPIAPERLRALGSKSNDGTVTLHWNEADDGSILKYQVAYGKTGETGAAWRDIRGSHALWTYHTVKGLENGEEYAFRLRAVNAVGEGAASAVRWAAPGSVTVHGVTLSRFKLEPGEDRLELRWSKWGGVFCGYVIKWRETGDTGEWASHEFGSKSGSPEYTIADLKAGTGYDVRLYVQSGHENKADGLAWERTRTTTGTAMAPPITPSAPALSWARVNGAELALRFDAALDESSVPAGSAFAVSVAGASRSVSAVSVSLETVTLTLGEAVTPGEVVTVGYTPPSQAKLRASGGGTAVAAFSDQAVTNDTPAEQPGRPAALTASVASAPAEHRGRGAFTVQVAFSEAVAGGAKAAAKTMQVTGGTLVRARRAGGAADRWAFDLRPSGNGAVTLTLPATTDCAAAGAVCTADGRKLESALTHTVPGPAMLSAADARATEGEDATIDFAVTLSRAVSGEVTVRYVTRDATAKVGRDYRKAKGTLTFAAGETAKTLSVTLIDDAKDEGEETFLLKLYKPKGAVIADGEATGTIENDDPMPAAWLARFGRTVAGQAVDTVTERFDGGGGSHVTLGGQPVRLDTPEGQAQAAAELDAVAAALGARPDEARDRDAWMRGGDRAVPSHTMTGRELLLGSAFHLESGGEAGGPAYAAWGRVATGGFDGEEDGVAMDGEVTTGFLGADVAGERWLAGAAVAYSRGEGSYALAGDAAGASAFDKGTVETTLTSVLPYARLHLNERVSAWGMAGWGTGELTLTEENGTETDRHTADLSMTLGAVGGRGTLVPAPEGGGFALALKSDAFWVRTESDATEGMEGAKGDATRLRLTLDASRPVALGAGTLTPSLEVGLRHDGGDAETGAGVELGGGLGYTNPDSGLSMEARARWLAAHESSGYEEWGASGSVRIDPGARGRGLSLTLAPTVGNAGSGTGTLWSAADARGIAPAGTEFEAARRLDAEVGYGLSGPFRLGTATPYAGLGLADGGARAWRAGVRWQLAPKVSLDLEGTRGESAGSPPEQGLMLRGAVRW